jgi:hypothetical protein
MQNYSRNLCWKLGLASFLLDPPLNTSPKLQKVLPCRHPCHTWNLRPVWSGKVPTFILSTAEIPRIDSGPQIPCEPALNYQHSREEIRDVASHWWMPNDWRLWCTAKSRSWHVPCFFFNHLPYYSLTPLSPLQRVPELPARHACNFQICTVERFPSLAADIKSKTQRSLCSNHGVTGNSGAARVLSPGHELIAYLLIATILSRAMIGGEPAVSYRWTGWIWEITGWSSRLQENYPSF